MVNHNHTALNKPLGKSRDYEGRENDTSKKKKDDRYNGELNNNFVSLV